MQNDEWICRVADYYWVCIVCSTDLLFVLLVLISRYQSSTIALHNIKKKYSSIQPNKKKVEKKKKQKKGVNK